MNKLEKLLIHLALLLSAATTWPQQSSIQLPRWREVDCYHNMVASAGGGSGGILINSILHEPTRFGLVANAEVDYIRMIDRHRGVRTGLGVHRLSSSFSLDGTQTQTTIPVNIADESGEHEVLADMIFTSGGLTERYEMIMLEAPIQLVYAYEHFFVYGGLRFAFPLRLNAHYSSADSRLDMLGIPALGSILEEPLCVATYAGVNSSEPDIDWSGRNLFCAISLECGYRWSIGKTASVRVGVYADYAVKGLHSGCEGMDPLMSFKGGELVVVTPMQSDLISGYNYISFGMKVGYQWGIGNNVAEYKITENRGFLGRWLRRLNYKRLLRQMNR